MKKESYESYESYDAFGDEDFADYTAKETIAEKPSWKSRWSSDYWRDSGQTRKGSVSSFWSERFGGWSSAWGSSTSKGPEEYINHVKALNAASRIGKIISDDAETSFHWNENQASISGEGPAVILDSTPLAKDVKLPKDWEAADCVDAVVGGALAEAAKRQSTPENDPPGRLTPSPLATPFTKHLWETLRWMRGVNSIREEFPGYADYFDQNRSFFHREEALAEVKTNIAAALAKDSRALNAVLAATTWNALTNTERVELPDPALESISNEVEKMLWEAAQEKDTEAVYTKHFPAILKKLSGLNLLATSPCPPMGVTQADSNLDEDTAKEIEDYAKNDLTEEEKQGEIAGVLKTTAICSHSTVSMKQPSDAGQYHASLDAVRAFISATKNALAFRNEIARVDETNLRKGMLDENALYRLADNCLKVFRRQEIVSAPSVHLGILVDESGSMSSYGDFPRRTKTRADIARECAILMYESCKKLKDVAVSVYGHSEYSNVELYRYIERNKGDMYSLGSIVARAGNVDGPAIAHAAKRMLKNTKPGETPILFVLSDGQPAYSTPSLNGQQHTRLTINHCRKHGIQLFGIGMGSGLAEEDLIDMYGKDFYRYVPDAQQLPIVLKQLLTSVLRKGSV